MPLIHFTPDSLRTSVSEATIRGPTLPVEQRAERLVAAVLRHRRRVEVLPVVGRRVAGALAA